VFNDQDQLGGIGGNETLLMVLPQWYDVVRTIGAARADPGMTYTALLVT
jgi:hypothetical protein